MGSSKDDAATDGDDSSGELPDSDSCLFTDGEKVLAYHGPLIYEAKVQKAEIRKKEWKYFVHYLGWSKNWDEWVTADRLLKHTKDNVIKQQDLDKKQEVEKNPKSGRSTQIKPKISTDSKADKDEAKNSGPKGKKRKISSGAEKDNVLVDRIFKIQVPSTLKKQLVDDWDFVTQQNKLVKLPRSPNVDDIIKKYLDYRSKQEGIIGDSVGEVLKGLKCYFEKSLPVILLYKNERQQFTKAVTDNNSNISLSSIYGAEHLLRLFVKLPGLLSYVNIEAETLISLQQKLLDFLKYLQKNQVSFFLSAYEGSKAVEGTDKGKE
jgi:mortality factor 4-like protein 1